MAEMKISNTLVNDTSDKTIAYAEQLKQQIINWAEYNHVTEKLGPNNRPSTQNLLNNLFLRVYEEFLTFLNNADATDQAINTWKEIEAFLAGYTDDKTLASIVAQLNANIESRLNVQLANETGDSTTTTMTQKAITEAIDYVASSVQNELALGAVYDVSAKNPTAGSNNDGKFESLSALLSDANLNTLIPTAYRKGGMSIKFVQSSDNKYVQYRLMADEWSTNTENWAIADEGVYVDNPEFVYVKTDKDDKILCAIKTDGGIYYGAGCPQQVKDYIEEKIGDFSPGKYEDIVAFLNGLEEGDKTLQQLLDEKLDSDGLDPVALSTMEVVQSQKYIEAKIDLTGKLLEARKNDGTKVINTPVELQGVKQEAIENDELLQVVTDLEGKIIEGMYKNGKRFSNVGITSPEIEEMKKDLEEICTNVSDNFFLPPHIYVAVGRTIELYYEQIVLNAKKYNIDVRCNIGFALNRKFQIVGTSDNIGDYTLTMYVRNDSNKILAEGQSTIHIVSNVIADSHNVLPVGTSITNNKPWLTELHTLSGNITCVGRRGNSNYNHEGRSGAGISFYNNKGTQKYDFDDNYKGTGSNSSFFDESVSYSVGDYCKKSIPASRGGYKTAVFRFINNHQGTWSDSDVYNVSMTNPLYDPNNDRISLNYYKSFQNLDFDILILEMGANGMNDTPATNPNGAKGLKDLVDNIRLDDATIPIVIVAPMMQSSQNGIGKQGNTDGYHNETDYKFHSDKKHLDYAKVACDFLKDYSNVYFCPMMECHDSEYNFGNTKVAVNPRLTDTTTVFELQPEDSVHPQDSGYMQMADAIFSTICFILNNN